MLQNHRSRARSVPNIFREQNDVPSIVHDESGATYNIGVLLGKGGFAKCYLAYSDSQEFALKVISKNSIKGISYLNKIRKEILIHFTLRHPNIVTLYSTFEDAKNIYMLLEYCPNRTLAEYIESRSERHIVESTAIVILKQLLKAVRYLHAKCGLLHRDIKPGNILLSCENTVKLADFGFCCSIAELERRQTHTVCGTPNYVPAEVLDRMGHSIYSESWSIACTFYCMLFGRPPFHSDCQDVTYARIRKCCYTFPSGFGVSREARDLIAKVLVRNPCHRLGAEEMLLHPLFSSLNRCVSHSNGLNNKSVRSSSRNRRVSGNHSSCADSLNSDKRSSNKNLLIDSGLGSGGDLCTTSNHTDVRYGTINSSTSNFEPLDVRHYVKVLSNCINIFEPLFLSLVSEDLCDSFIAKWVDYTNKFGFGVTLKNGTRSLLLNDNSSISVSNSCSRFMFFTNRSGQKKYAGEWRSCHDIGDPSIAEKFQFMSYLRAYMDRELYSFVSIGPFSTTNDDRCNFDPHASFRREDDRSICVNFHNDTNPSLTYLVAVWKCPMGLLMLLSDGTCQMNFSESRYKIIICRCQPIKSHLEFSSQIASYFRVFIITPEHSVYAYETALDTELNCSLPPDEFVEQLNAFKCVMQQFVHKSFVDNNINHNLPYADDNRVEEDYVIEKFRRLRSSTDC